MDLDALREALEWFDAHRYAITPEDQAIVAAARAVLDSEEVWWCETHRCDAIPRLGGEVERCWKGEFVRHLSIADGSMVRRRLLAEEGT